MTHPRLLYVVNDPRFFLSHRRLLALAAREAGYDVHVAIPRAPGWDEVVSEGHPVHEIRMDRRSLNPLGELQSVRSLIRVFRTVRPDLIHHLTIKPVVYGGIAARLTRVPAVVNAVTGLGWVFLGAGAKAGLARRMAYAGYRLAFRHPNAQTIFQNQDDRDLFVARRLLAGENTVLIGGSGVDMERFPIRPAPMFPEPLVVLPARMLWDKGIGDFVEAARTVKQKGVAARFVLVGGVDPGNRSAIPPATLDSWVEEGVVEWWGYCHDMANIYGQAAIVCLPSRREGVPLALLEAAASGRPVVTTDAPGCRDAVRHEESGLLVPLGDIPALAAALRRLIDDPALCENMGRSGRALVEASFSLDKVVSATIALYDTMTNGQKKR